MGIGSAQLVGIRNGNAHPRLVCTGYYRFAILAGRIRGSYLQRDPAQPVFRRIGRPDRPPGHTDHTAADLRRPGERHSIAGTCRHGTAVAGLCYRRYSRAGTTIGFCCEVCADRRHSTNWRSTQCDGLFPSHHGLSAHLRRTAGCGPVFHVGYRRGLWRCRRALPGERTAGLANHANTQTSQREYKALDRLKVGFFLHPP